MITRSSDSKTASQGASNIIARYSQVIYAVILIALVPTTIIFNTLYVIRKFRTNIDLQLQRQALLVSEIINATSIASSSDLSSLQQKIERILERSEEVQSIDVMENTAYGFRVIASSLSENLGQQADQLNNTIAWNRDQAIAHLARPSPQDIDKNPELAGVRYWNVVIPLHDNEGRKVGLLNLKMSLQIMDALTRQTLVGSTVLLVVTLVVVLGLLLVNMRLFEFAVLARKLEEVNAMKDEFVSMASHELRGPLTALKGYASMFADGSLGTMSAQGKKALAIIEASIRHISDLVDDLLDVSRIEQHRLEMRFEPTSLAASISQVIEEFKMHAEAKRISLVFERADQRIPPVYADKNKLHQVIVNLLSNAIKYTREGSVTVRAKADDEKATVKIKDTGIGIAAKDREKLFKKFYRVSNAATKGTIGTGLGLWITRQLVTLMGGEIYVDSLVGVGSEVTFTLPLYAVHTKPRPASTVKQRSV